MEREDRRIKTCISFFYGVPGRTIAWGRAPSLFFHDEAERVVIDGAEQNDCGTDGKACRKHLASYSLGCLQELGIGEPRSSHHASAITIREQRLSQPFAEGRSPHSPVGRFPPRDKSCRALPKDG